MEKCGYRSVIACSARGCFCPIDVNLTMRSAALRVNAPRARSTRGLTSPIISSIERIAALCGVEPTLNEKTHVNRVGRLNLTDQPSLCYVGIGVAAINR